MKYKIREKLKFGDNQNALFYFTYILSPKHKTNKVDEAAQQNVQKRGGSPGYPYPIGPGCGIEPDGPK